MKASSHKKQCANFLYIVLLIIVFQATTSKSQEKENNLKLVGYTEAYFNFDLDQPENRQRPGFVYNHKRHNEFNINLAYLGYNYNNQKVKSNFVLMAGNYAQYNLSTEPNILQNIMEATAGFKLSEKHNLWIEAGIFPSHLGFESAVALDCQTLTRSILAENSPYYESGLKINYGSKNEKHNFTFLLLNGWQKIARNQNDEAPALGLQYQYKPNASWTLNYSNFAGYMNGKDPLSFRHFHNLYAQRKGKGSWDYTLGFDIGMQNNQTWYSPVATARYAISEKNYSVLRAEYYHDPNLVITSTPGREPFSVAGFSVGYDFLPTPNAALRFEAKQYIAQQRTFMSIDGKVNVCFTMSLSAKLD
jgi:hypothetical protein